MRPDTYLTVRQTGFPAGGYNVPDRSDMFAKWILQYREIEWPDLRERKVAYPVRFIGRIIGWSGPLDGKLVMPSRIYRVG